MEVFEFIAALGPWVWLIIGILLVILEVFAPGAVFLWLGVAAGAVFILVFLMPDLDWRLQLVLFSVFSIASVFLSRKYLKKKPIETENPSLNRRAEQYLGREVTLDRPIEGGTGRVRIDDSSWRVKGPDLASGVKVRVAGVEGSTLVVELIGQED